MKHKMLNEDALDSLIETLKLAKQVGYTSSSSPIGFLLEAGTDICLQLSSLFKEGTKEAKKNPEVKFNYEVSDSLGNPKSFKVQEDPKTYWDPQLSEKFKQLASFFVLVKKDQPKALEFMSGVKEDSKKTTSNEMEQDENERKIKLEVAKVATLAYHRRQRKKRSISKYQP